MNDNIFWKNGRTTLLMVLVSMAEGSLEVKLPTVWTDRKAEVGRVREEKRREEERSSKQIYTTLITHYNYNSATPHYNYNHNCTTLHHTTSSSCGWGDHCNHCNHSKKHNFNHLSVHQWIRSAIRDSHQPTSPIGFLFLKLPPPCAVLLVSQLDHLGSHGHDW